MKKIYLVRHGESQANAGGIYLGGETPLTERGHEQARFIAERASKLPVEVIISSTLLRARQTAAHIVERVGKPLETSELFVEKRSPSEFVGRVEPQDGEAKKQEIARMMRFGEPGFRYADEENFDDMKERADAAVTFLENRPENEILVVTHGLFLRVLMGRLIFGKEFTGREGARFVRGLKTENTGLTVLQYDPADAYSAWRILIWNDHAHLAD